MNHATAQRNATQGRGALRPRFDAITKADAWKYMHICMQVCVCVLLHCMHFMRDRSYQLLNASLIKRIDKPREC